MERIRTMELSQKMKPATRTKENRAIILGVIHIVGNLSNCTVEQRIAFAKKCSEAVIKKASGIKDEGSVENQKSFMQKIETGFMGVTVVIKNGSVQLHCEEHMISNQNISDLIVIMSIPGTSGHLVIIGKCQIKCQIVAMVLDMFSDRLADEVIHDVSTIKTRSTGVSEEKKIAVQKQMSEAPPPSMSSSVPVLKIQNKQASLAPAHSDLYPRVSGNLPKTYTHPAEAMIIPMLSAMPTSKQEIMAKVKQEIIAKQMKPFDFSTPVSSPSIVDSNCSRAASISNVSFPKKRISQPLKTNVASSGDVVQHQSREPYPVNESATCMARPKSMVEFLGLSADFTFYEHSSEIQCPMTAPVQSSGFTGSEDNSKIQCLMTAHVQSSGFKGSEDSSKIQSPMTAPAHSSPTYENLQPISPTSIPFISASTAGNEVKPPKKKSKPLLMVGKVKDKLGNISSKAQDKDETSSIQEKPMVLLKSPKKAGIWKTLTKKDKNKYMDELDIDSFMTGKINIKGFDCSPEIVGYPQPKTNIYEQQIPIKSVLDNNQLSSVAEPTKHRTSSQQTAAEQIGLYPTLQTTTFSGLCDSDSDDNDNEFSCDSGDEIYDTIGDRRQIQSHSMKNFINIFLTNEYEYLGILERISKATGSLSPKLQALLRGSETLYETHNNMYGELYASMDSCLKIARVFLSYEEELQLYKYYLMNSPDISQQLRDLPEEIRGEHPQLEDDIKSSWKRIHYYHMNFEKMCSMAREEDKAVILGVVHMLKNLNLQADSGILLDSVKDAPYNLHLRGPLLLHHSFKITGPGLVKGRFFHVLLFEDVIVATYPRGDQYEFQADFRIEQTDFVPCEDQLKFVLDVDRGGSRDRQSFTFKSTEANVKEMWLQEVRKLKEAFAERVKAERNKRYGIQDMEEYV